MDTNNREKRGKAKEKRGETKRRQTKSPEEEENPKTEPTANRLEASENLFHVRLLSDNGLPFVIFGNLFFFFFACRPKEERNVKPKGEKKKR